jgi:protein ImuA
VRSLHAIASLRQTIRRIEAGGRGPPGQLSFGLAPLDEALGGGLPLGAVHDIAGGEGECGLAAASLFAAGILARLPGPVLWCLTRPDLFAPTLAQAGLAPDRVIYAEARNETECLACFEEGLRHSGLAGAVAELRQLSMTQSRRLLLAAEAGGGLGIVLRRWRPPADRPNFAEPNAAATRWRVSTAPSAILPIPGIGKPRWRVELLRCRGGTHADLIVEACDEQGCLALPAGLADRAPVPDIQRHA